MDSAPWNQKDHVMFQMFVCGVKWWNRKAMLPTLEIHKFDFACMQYSQRY